MKTVLVKCAQKDYYLMGAGAKETSKRLEVVFNQYRPGVNFTRPASLPVSTLHEHQSGVPDSRKEKWVGSVKSGKLILYLFYIW